MSEQVLINLVDKATSEYLIQTDWAVNMQLCDTLNNDPSGAKEVIKQVAKKLKEKKPGVPMYALELLETLMINCECVHFHVGGKEFQADLIKLIQNKKTKDNVREKALELAQYWADSFQSRRDLPLYNQTHLLLRRAGIPFPPRRKDQPPLVFKSAPAPAPHQPVFPPTSVPSSSSLPSVHPKEVFLKDFSSLQESVNLVMEMMSYTNPEEEDPAANDILRDI